MHKLTLFNKRVFKPSLEENIRGFKILFWMLVMLGVLYLFYLITS
jgi:hypothetical protein